MTFVGNRMNRSDYRIVKDNEPSTEALKGEHIRPSHQAHGQVRVYWFCVWLVVCVLCPRVVMFMYNAIFAMACVSSLLVCAWTCKICPPLLCPVS